jgi:predicted metal-dependent phosphoesterase TrpH
VLNVDLHLHTADDPVDHLSYSAFTLVDRAAALGFGALAITLHDRQLESERLTAYARERGIVLVRGVERTIHRRHVLLLGFDAEATAAVRTLDDVARLRATGRGLVIAPHPFFPDRSCLRGALDAHPEAFDAVEWSYFWTRAVNCNARAARWAAQYGKPIVGNSDLHDLRQLGRTFSLVDAPPEPAAILEAIRQGRVVLRTSPAPVLQGASVFGGMLLRSLRGPKRPPERTVGSDLDFCAGDVRITL